MSQTYECFLIERTDRCQRWLRRYRADDLASGVACPTDPAGYHQAWTPIEDGRVLEVTDEVPGRIIYRTEPMTWPRDDPRWPTHCSCGYVFAEGDHWQLFWETIYRRVDNPSVELTLRDVPPGAIWPAPWYPPEWGYQGGPPLVVQTPGGPWCLGQPEHGTGLHWEVSGTPPRLTAYPSILIGGSRPYHGWLRDGKLVPA